MVSHSTRPFHCTGRPRASLLQSIAKAARVAQHSKEDPSPGTTWAGCGISAGIWAPGHQLNHIPATGLGKAPGIAKRGHLALLSLIPSRAVGVFSFRAVTVQACPSAPGQLSSAWGLHRPVRGARWAGEVTVLQSLGKPLGTLGLWEVPAMAHSSALVQGT